MGFETHSNVWVLENIGCTAPGLHPTDSIIGDHPCPKLRRVRDEQCPHGPLGKGKFHCSRQIWPALNSWNPFSRLFLEKTPGLYQGRLGGSGVSTSLYRQVNTHILTGGNCQSRVDLEIRKFGTCK